MKLQDHVVVLFLVFFVVVVVFRGTSCCFPWQLHHFVFLLVVCTVSRVSTSSPTLVGLYMYGFVAFFFFFFCIFLMFGYLEYLFMCLLGIHMSHHFFFISAAYAFSRNLLEINLIVLHMLSVCF